MPCPVITGSLVHQLVPGVIKGFALLVTGNCQAKFLFEHVALSEVWLGCEGKECVGEIERSLLGSVDTVVSSSGLGYMCLFPSGSLNGVGWKLQIT